MQRQQIQQQGRNWVDLNIQAHYQQNCCFVVADRYVVAVGGLHQNNPGPNNSVLKCLDIDLDPTNPANLPNRFFWPIPTQDSQVQALLNLRHFSACFDGKNKIIVCGGRDNHGHLSNQVFVITLQEQDNERRRFANCKILQTVNNGCWRYGHTAHIHQNKMYIIGGRAPEGPIPQRQNNSDLWILSLNAPYTWERVNMPQESPHDTDTISRWTSGHKSVLIGSKVYVYNADDRYPLKHINEHLYVMDLANQQLRWERIQAPILDPQREKDPLKFDEMLEINNRLYFFERNPANQLTNPLNIYSYDIRQNRWDTIVVGQPNGMPAQFKLMTYGGRFILWGYDQLLFPSNGRIFSLNLEKNNPQTLPPNSRQIQLILNWNQRHNPAPRPRDSSLVIVGKYIIAIGGHPTQIKIYDPQANVYHDVGFTPDSEHLNMAQFSVCAYKKNKIIIFGARNLAVRNTIFVITLQEDERGIFANCKAHDTRNPNDYRRTGHTAHIYNDTMYVLGGQVANAANLNNQIWRLNLNPPYTWENVDIPNNNPNWACGHKSILKDGKIYVYSEDERFPIQYLNENLYVMNLEAQQLRWERIQARGLNVPLEPLNFNDMLEIDNKLYFFERNPPGLMTYPKNIHLYNIGTNQWEQQGVNCPNGVPVDFKMITYHGQIILWEHYLNQNNVANGIIYSLGNVNPIQVPDYPGQIRALEQVQQGQRQQLRNKQTEIGDKDGRIRDLERENTRQENDLRNRDNAIRGLEERRQNLRREIEIEEVKMTDLEARQRNAQVQLRKGEIENEIRRHQSGLETLRNQNAELEGRNEYLEHVLEREQNQNRAVEERKNQKHDNLRSAQMARNYAEQEIIARENELQNQRELCTGLEERNAQMIRNLQNKDREIRAIQEDNKELQNKNRSYLQWLVLVILCVISLWYRKL